MAMVASLVAVCGASASGRSATPVWSSPRLVGTLSHGEPTQMLSVDLNGDGLRDVIVGATVWERPDPQPPIFLINQGGGRLVDETRTLFIGPPPQVEWDRQLLTADFNRDGRPDVLIAGHGWVNDSDPSFVRTGDRQYLILSTGDGHYVDASSNLPQQLTFTHSAAVADVNGDGAPDIFENNLGCCSASHVQAQLLLNDGTGRFTVAAGALHGILQDQYGNDHSFACALADVNGDGSPDLVLGGSEAENFSQVLLNDGHGHFTFSGTLPPMPGPPNNAFVIDINATDINHDGAADLIFGESLSDPWYIGTTIQILVNDGHGHFTDATATWLPKQPTTSGWPNRILTEDVNDDGKPDLTIQYAAAGRDPTPLWLNDGTQFTPAAAPADGDYGAGGLGPVAYINGAGPHALVSTEWADSNGGTPNVFVTPQVVSPAVPAGLRADTFSGHVRVTWGRVAGAVTYAVWRAPAGGGAFLHVGTTGKASFVDRPPPHGRAYRYEVDARNAAGVSDRSAPVLWRRR